MISEKNILYTDFEGEKLARICLGKIISCTEKNFPHDVYNADKKNLTLLYLREKTPGLEKKFSPKLNHPYPLPHKSQMGNHIGGGEEAGEFDTLADVIRKENGWRAYIMWWFLRLKFYISRLKIRR